ncbi:CYTH-like domain-containing protein [Hyaloraphidium curvatum]|nr:CYTH-like domain-containing protein [Hyaloraphidium curvatum]
MMAEAAPGPSALGKRGPGSDGRASASPAHGSEGSPHHDDSRPAKRTRAERDSPALPPDPPTRDASPHRSDMLADHGGAHTDAMGPRRPPSMFDVEPCDDVTRVVALFLRPFVGRPNLEIEAKLGVIFDKQTGRRVNMGIDTEAVVRDYGATRFESNMTEQQHQFFNTLLNDRVQRARPEVRYEHKYELDEFFEVQGAQKVRVTKDFKSNKVTASIQKQRLANLDVHIPESLVDYRISVNVEHQVPVPYGRYPVSRRQKDRISYTYDAFSIDLTQVWNLHAQGNERQSAEASHELEIEFLDANATLGPHAQEWNRGDRAAERRFQDEVRLMLNNVRYLARKMPLQSA